jgi:hypothetical protein
MSAAVLLERLTGVRQTGPGKWQARCPAHEDRSPSLSVRELPDGRVLLHDFGGCDTADVLAAAGLRMADLFPDACAHQLSPSRSGIPPSDLLRILEHEILIVGLTGARFLETRTLTEEEWQLLAVALERIEAGLAHARGLR